MIPNIDPNVLIHAIKPHERKLLIFFLYDQFRNNASAHRPTAHAITGIAPTYIS